MAVGKAAYVAEGNELGEFYSRSNPLPIFGSLAVIFGSLNSLGEG